MAKNVKGAQKKKNSNNERRSKKTSPIRGKKNKASTPSTKRKNSKTSSKSVTKKNLSAKKNKLTPQKMSAIKKAYKSPLKVDRSTKKQGALTKSRVVKKKPAKSSQVKISSKSRSTQPAKKSSTPKKRIDNTKRKLQSVKVKSILKKQKDKKMMIKANQIAKKKKLLVKSQATTRKAKLQSVKTKQILTKAKLISTKRPVKQATKANQITKKKKLAVKNQATTRKAKLQSVKTKQKLNKAKLISTKRPVKQATKANQIAKKKKLPVKNQATTRKAKLQSVKTKQILAKAKLLSTKRPVKTIQKLNLASTKKTPLTKKSTNLQTKVEITTKNVQFDQRVTRSTRTTSRAERFKRKANSSPSDKARKTMRKVEQNKNNSPQLGKFDMKIQLKTSNKEKDTGNNAKKGAHENIASESNHSTGIIDLTDKNENHDLNDVGRRLLCLDCGKAFYSRLDLTQHKRVNCDSIFQPKTKSPDKNNKPEKSNLPQTILMCSQCGINCQSKEEFIKHKESCQEEGKSDKTIRKCHYCNPFVWITGFSAFLNHMRNIHGLKQNQNLFMCNKCLSLFLTMDDLQDHHKQECKPNNSEVKNKAPLKVVKDMRQYKAATSCTKDTNVYECRKCPQHVIFNSEKSLMEHNRVKHKIFGQELYQCNVCEKCFYYYDTLMDHASFHHGANKKILLPMHEILRKIQQIPRSPKVSVAKPKAGAAQEGPGDRGLGSMASAATPFITELTASNDNQAFAIHIDTSSGKPQVTVGLNGDANPTPAQTLTDDIGSKKSPKNVQQASSTPKLNIFAGKEPPKKVSLPGNKVGYLMPVIGSLNLVSAKPIESVTTNGQGAVIHASQNSQTNHATPVPIVVTPQNEPSMHDFAADNVQQNLFTACIPKNQSGRAGVNTPKSPQTPKKVYEASKQTVHLQQAQGHSHITANTRTSQPIRFRDCTKRSATTTIKDAPTLQLQRSTRSMATADQKPMLQRSTRSDHTTDIAKAQEITPAKSKSSAQIEPSLSCAKNTRLVSSSDGTSTTRRFNFKTITVPMLSRMLSAKSPRGKKIMVPIGITQGIHVQPCAGRTDRLRCSACGMELSNMSQVTKHTCVRCLKCSMMLPSVMQVAEHVCTAYH